MGINGVNYMDGVTSAPVSESASMSKVSAPVSTSQEASTVSNPTNSAPVQKDTYQSQTPDASGEPVQQDDRHIISSLDKAINAVNKKLGNNSYMQYDYFKPTKTVVVTVIDRETQEVIREIPPKKHLEAIAKMWELAGIIVDEKR